MHDCSRWVYLYPLPNKEGQSVLERFVEYKAETENETRMKIQILRADRGKEYKNHKLLRDFDIYSLFFYCNNSSVRGRLGRPDHLRVALGSFLSRV